MLLAVEHHLAVGLGAVIAAHPGIALGPDRQGVGHVADPEPAGRAHDDPAPEALAVVGAGVVAAFAAAGEEDVALVDPGQLLKLRPGVADLAEARRLGPAVLGAALLGPVVAREAVGGDDDVAAFGQLAEGAGAVVPVEAVTAVQVDQDRPVVIRLELPERPFHAAVVHPARDHAHVLVLDQDHGVVPGPLQLVVLDRRDPRAGREQEQGQPRSGPGRSEVCQTP